jgi:uncharacterized small protein (DUF1192 family)
MAKWIFYYGAVTAGIKGGIMDIEDFEPRQKKPKPKDLSAISVGDLEEYIAMLEAEIARVREEIARKSSHKDAASKFFKS